MDELTRAKKRALYLLTDMDRTEQQLTEKLEKTGYAPETVKAVLEYVKQYGYIDDSRYASHYIQNLKGSRSKKRLLFDLNQKGVPKDIIAAAFEENGDYDECPLIRKLAQKKWKTLSSTDPRSFQKLAAYLARKGFRSHDIYTVIDEFRHSD